MAENEKLLTYREIERQFGGISYDGWELVELGGGGYTVQYKIAFRIPYKEKDWLFHYLFNTPSRLVPLYEFVHKAPKAFSSIICLEADGWQVQNLTPDDWHSWAIHATGEMVEEALQQMIEDGGVPDAALQEGDKPANRMDTQRITIWERKLLDLTMSNALINTRYGNNCLALTDQASEELLNHWLNKPTMGLISEEQSGIGFHVALPKDEMQKRALSLLKRAKNNLEETGSEQLFVGFGMLHWVDNPDPLHPKKPCGTHMAPVALMPVGIERQKVTGEFYLKAHAEDVIPNITLIELLKQDHERNLLDLVPKNDRSVGLATILKVFEQCAQSKADKGWSFTSDMCVGLFSFAKFVMWNDVHNNSSELRHAPLVESLIQKTLQNDLSLDDLDIHQLDSTLSLTNTIFPIQSDSSQMSAVVQAIRGKSFLLYGPPGSGKSQTITNIISNAIFQRQSVLFVAQKRAALEVVQERLTQIGLDPYFIELHSNKVTKSYLIEQLTHALAQADADDSPCAFEQEAQRLQRTQEELIKYEQAVHRAYMMAGEQVSLADCIEQCLSSAAPYELLLPKAVLLNTSLSCVEEVDKLLREMVQLRADMLKEQQGKKPWQICLHNWAYFDLGLSNITPYRYHYQWQKRVNQLRAWKMLSLLPLTEEMEVDKIIQHLRYELAHQRAMHIIEQDECLLMFQSKTFNEVVTTYRQQASLLQQTTREQLQLTCRKAIRQVVLSTNSCTQTSLVEIRRWIKNRGRGVSIRSMMEYHGNTIRQLCPCMLMSPMSVAQYLPIQNQLFSLVLFDEASQIPTAEAIGAIARAKATIVVGDPKQMPPTTFFQREIDTDDEVEYNDMESILDDCITLGMPYQYLNYHYRSRHESLIAFSNHYYYGDHLITFPSVDRDSHVYYQYIRGIYDYSKSRTNRKEAEAIVDEVVRRLQDPSDHRSMGIIAFSVVQQNLIDDLLQERIGHNQALSAKAYGDDVKEPLFVKNLENVQGDERDVILFSVCYGPAEDGKISMNFGPLNNAGGERRLNVAVTRARQQMIVFSSMHSEDIDLDKSNTLGVEGLKNFLYYAENGELPEEKTIQQHQPKNQLAESLAKDLRKLGYQVETNVGHSAFRVDVAVMDTKHPDRYMLGILFDGKQYHQTPCVRDREIVQPTILEGLGWRILRVWQEDYFRHPKEVLSQITKYIVSCY